MIKNERQFRITKAQVAQFDHTLTKLIEEGEATPMHPLLKKAQIDALRSQRADLQAEVDEYQQLLPAKDKP